MELLEYQTRVKMVKAVVWDGTDTTYDIIAPIIGRSIKAYTKQNGSDIGSLDVKVDTVNIKTVNIGDYIVILDELTGSFTLLSPIEFNQKYEPVVKDSGFVTDVEEDIIAPGTAITTYRG